MRMFECTQLWNAGTCSCIGLTLLEASGMCVEFNRSGKYISVGLKHGGVAVYVVNLQRNSSTSRRRGGGFSSRGSSRSSVRSYTTTSTTADNGNETYIHIQLRPFLTNVMYLSCRITWRILPGLLQKGCKRGNF